MAWMWENVKKEQERCSGWVEMLMGQREDHSAQRWEGFFSQPPQTPLCSLLGHGTAALHRGLRADQSGLDGGLSNSHAVVWPSHAFAMKLMVLW